MADRVTPRLPFYLRTLLPQGVLPSSTVEGLAICRPMASVGPAGCHASVQQPSSWQPYREARLSNPGPASGPLLA